MSHHYNDGTATKTQVRGGRTKFNFLHVINLRTTVAYLQLFDALSDDVTLGTDTPTYELVIPNQAGTANGAGFVLALPKPIRFATGLTYAITTTKSGPTAVDANDVLLNLQYEAG